MVNSLSSQANAGVVESPDNDADELHLEQFLTYRLNVLSNMLNRQMERFYKQRFGISLPDWRVLANLGRFQDMSVRDLAVHSQMDKALVSRTVARLVKRGLVISQPDASDGRLVALSLTVEGQKMYEAIIPLARKRQQRLFDCLDRKDRVTLDRALEQLTAMVRDSELRKSEINDEW